VFALTKSLRTYSGSSFIVHSPADPQDPRIEAFTDHDKDDLIFGRLPGLITSGVRTQIWMGAGRRIWGRHSNTSSRSDSGGRSRENDHAAEHMTLMSAVERLDLRHFETLERIGNAGVIKAKRWCRGQSGRVLCWSNSGGQTQGMYWPPLIVPMTNGRSHLFCALTVMSSL
jgi:hypothetical protein